MCLSFEINSLRYAKQLHLLLGEILTHLNLKTSFTFNGNANYLNISCGVCVYVGESVPACEKAPH